MPDPNDPPAAGVKREDLRLNGLERGGAITLTVLFVIVGLTLVLKPPTNTTTETVTGSTPTPVVTTTVAPADISTVATGLFGFALLLALVAVLGVRFTSIKVASATLSQDTSGEAAEITQDEADADLNVNRNLAPTPAVAASSEDLWQSLNGWAREALIDWANSGQQRVLRPITKAIAKAEKQPGQGNHPWYVTLKADDGSEIILKVSTGRGSRTSREQHAA